tara:strand:- start:537 stop:839 length:303 start_codon:yes stop_codon:yes gene_type:complete
MDKIPVENLYSMFPSVEKDVIDMIYSQYDSNIIDTLLEISVSSETKKDEGKPKLKGVQQNNENESESEEKENNKERNSAINNLLNMINFNKKDEYKYERL